MILNVMVVLAGISLALFAGRDVWQTLFTSRGRGNLNRALTRGIWRLFWALSRRRPEWLALAGPTAFLVVISSWVFLVAVGFALVYWTFMPGAFSVDDADTTPGFLQALYFSLVTLATLGYGDVVPDAGWAKVIAPLEAITGFVLLTAAISWLTSLYRTLSRRRALAYEVMTLRRALADRRVSGGVPQLSVPLTSYAASLGAIVADTEQSPTTHYWTGTVYERRAFVDALELLYSIASQTAGDSTASESARLHAVMLIEALHELAAQLKRDFVSREAPLAFDQAIEALRNAYAIPAKTGE